MSVEELIQAEVQRMEMLLRTTGTISTRKAASIRDLPTLPMPEIPWEANHLPSDFTASTVSADVYCFIQKEFTSFPAAKITDREIKQARKYTSDLLGVGLDNVRVEVIPTHQWDIPTSEGFHIPVGIEDHVIFVPELFESPEELLSHEFAHAAHTTAQRRNGELPYFFSNDITAEFVAHFCQFNYILERLTRSHFASAMGQFTTATFAVAIYASGSPDDFKAFIESSEAQAIRKVMPYSTLENQYLAFQRDKDYFFREVRRAIGLTLALLLIDEHGGMKKFISSDRVDRSLGDKLTAAFPEFAIQDSFSRINDQIFILLDRFLLRARGHR